MNKKLTMMILGVVVGTTMLCGSALAGNSGSLGYNAYKSAINESLTAKNVTSQVEVAVQDNGNSLINMDSKAKIDLTNQTMSGIITDKSINNAKTVNIYKQADQSVFKTSDSDVYYVSKRPTGKEWDGKHEQLDSSKIQDMEKVVDSLSGNLQNNIELSNNQDGTKDVSLKLESNQIPAVVNVLASLAAKNEDSEKHYNQDMESPFGSDFKANLPKLTDDVKIVNADVTADISADNRISAQTINITLSGKDADGKTHEITAKITMAFTDYNNTTPDTIDLTGKQVKEIQINRHHGE